jgi:hypothetical protein
VKLEFSPQIFEKYSNSKYNENSFIGSGVFPGGRADMTKVSVAFSNFGKVPKTLLHLTAVPLAI